MDFKQEKYISNLISNQFPSFYQEEGETFIQFVRAYYEWMEQEGNPIGEARRLMDYRDIDNTLEPFLEHFQKEYLYGIPFNIIANKRFLLKHILDVYRSKGTIQCYKLLFRLIYNEDVEVYLPSYDMLRISDGTWIEPKYIEVSPSAVTASYQGKQIYGVVSQTTAVVESYVQEAISQNIINILYISNISPKGGNFVTGEKIVLVDDKNDPNIISAAPSVLGSMSTLDITNGGQDFEIGDLIKVVHKDPSNNAVLSSGIDGILKVTGTGKSVGQLSFSIIYPGFGYLANAYTFVFPGEGDTTGTGAAFSVSSLSNVRNIEYNTDLICDFMNLSINATSYGFPANSTGNSTSTIGSVLSFTNNNFGSIAAISNIKTGKNYTNSAYSFVRSVQTSRNQAGNITYSNTSANVTGVGTIFSQLFQNNEVICLQANTSLNNTIEYLMIKSVNSDTSITLYSAPKFNSIGTYSKYRAAPTIMYSSFSIYGANLISENGSYYGNNEIIRSVPSIGGTTVTNVTAINSGKGFNDGEYIYAYLYNGINTPTVLNGGTGYANGEKLVFSGGGGISTPAGFVTTNSTGGIVSTTLTKKGSGFEALPTITVKTKKGTGAIFTTTISEFNTFSQIEGKVKKTGIGKNKGYWSTTRGFLSSDKYIQDSYYYQDYSYELRVPVILEKYKSILYDTFHTAGSEMFGKYLLIKTEESTSEILSESTVAIIT